MKQLIVNTLQIFTLVLFLGTAIGAFIAAIALGATVSPWYYLLFLWPLLVGSFIAALEQS